MQGGRCESALLVSSGDGEEKEIVLVSLDGRSREGGAQAQVYSQRTAACGRHSKERSACEPVRPGMMWHGVSWEMPCGG